MTNFLEIGRRHGLNNQEIRQIVKDVYAQIEKEKKMKEVLDCKNIEDLKILILDWIDRDLICKK